MYACIITCMHVLLHVRMYVHYILILQAATEIGIDMCSVFESGYFHNEDDLTIGDQISGVEITHLKLQQGIAIPVGDQVSQAHTYSCPVLSSHDVFVVVFKFYSGTWPSYLRTP